MTRRALCAAAGALAAAVVAFLALSATRGRPRSPFGYGVATAGANLGPGETVATCRTPRVPCPAGQLVLVPPFGGRSRAARAFDAFRRQVLLGRDRAGYMRLWIPYDALYAWSWATRRCSPSRFALTRLASFGGLNGIALAGQLVWDVQGVRALGLTPEVVISAGSGDGVPHYPDPVYGSPSELAAGITTAGYDYICGVRGVIGFLRAELRAAAPTKWEVANEPDSKPSYVGPRMAGCATASGACGAAPPGADYDRGGYLCGRPYADCGTLEAAELWELAEGVVVREGWSDERLAALTITSPVSGYLTPYVEQLNALASCAPGFVSGGPGRCATAGRFPRHWAVHDYDDATAGGTGELSSFEVTLSRLAAGHGPLEVWVTESGVEPNSPELGGWDRGGWDRGGWDRGGCPLRRGRTAAPESCAAYREAAQEAGARTWRRLLDVTAPGVRTAQVYWFEFELVAGWDSALVDRSGRPRPALCVLVRRVRC